MKTHPLLERSNKQRIQDPVGPDGASYGFTQGLWICESSLRPWILSKLEPGPITKKMDVESGEDAKGN